MTFTARQDRRYIRSTHRSNRFVLIDIFAPPARTERVRPPVNLAFVVDRSGSMTGEKLRLAKLAVEQSVARLRSDDRFAIVTYDNEVDVVFASAEATQDARRTALARLSEVEARASTDLAGGWLRGCDQVARRLSGEGVNRCLLLTDGLANVGITDADELAGHATELRARGVSTSTFGVGSDFDELLLQRMADAGGGNFYFIPGPAAITDHVTSEVGETLEVVAHEVAIAVTAEGGVTVESLTPFSAETSGPGTTIHVGSLVSEQHLQLVLRVNFPVGEIGRGSGLEFRVSDRDDVLSTAARRLDWQYADDRTNDIQDRDRDVDRAVARVFAARARQEAAGLNRAGNYPAAAATLTAVAKRISGYSAGDQELGSIVAELGREAQMVSAPMAPMAVKAMHFSSHNALRMRAASGQARRVPRTS
jgi:Ca-activated chloride channel family protein